MYLVGEIPQEAKARGNILDMLTWGQSFGW
jgi:hypothetical protein